jgi:choline kinase
MSKMTNKYMVEIAKAMKEYDAQNIGSDDQRDFLVN